MRVLFDHQTFSLQAYGGISRYYTELIKGINQTLENQAELPVLFSDNVHLQENNIPVKSFLPGIKFPKKGGLVYQINQAHSRFQLNKQDFDLFHPTYYDPYFLSRLQDKPFVVTVYDMIYERYGHLYSELRKDRTIIARKRELIKRADRIIAISENTKRDIVDLIGVDESKIEVIYLGNSTKLQKRDNKKSNSLTTSSYFLFVGKRYSYKNFRGLVQAILPLLIKNGVKLICAGGGAFTKEEQKFINSLGAERWVEHHAVHLQTLEQLYGSAIAFVFPSFYEGFGLPVLEAFASGCPCLLSNRGSLPEIAGQAALFIDPEQPDGINDAANLLIQQPELRKTLINAGYRQLEKYSWNQTVHQTLALYKSLIS
ncbi:glycosyltransferase family 4 protein [Spirosoma sp. KUDC1026]|uniref:glycosyltransferase family 4 protein n=1 Tax=Spirosoma sp. KUDC1026 TaxID=2745947 RepID=UPI00159BA203|nr:glycosyltransferase family 1 protein [Spirosoma sp. KUDC1026]QKZ11933.1 glycosyltransferase family 4 protein [Spirosoma sp. KUDC1026]